MRQLNSLQIRIERPEDYPAIAALHVRAFANRTSEAVIVALQRHRSGFDPELSLVAELDGRIVGHVLFSPQTIRLLDQDVRAVNLAPIAVDPQWQGQRIGEQLIHAGHDAARAKGYALSFLLGHTTYYPRFGYRTHAYGGSTLTVATESLDGDLLEARGPTEADLPALLALWRHEEDGVDMTIVPGPDLLDWLSPNPTIATQVWQYDEEVIGYTRVHTATPAEPRMFLARDPDTAHRIAAALAQHTNGEPLRLPLHPATASAAAFGQPDARSWDAAMVCPLVPGVFDTYESAIRSGTRPPGRPLWPSAFDLEE